MRRITKEINIGSVVIGGNNKIAVQSMTNTKTRDIDATLLQIEQLKRVNCDIVRLAVFCQEDANALSKIVSSCSLPIVADIHFNAQFALKSIESGVAKIRINPGNFPKESLNYIIDSAKEHNTAIRIGVNSGSLDKDLLSKGLSQQEVFLSGISQYIDMFEQRKFTKLVLSAKSTSVSQTIAVNCALSQKFDYPLHIGLTEAGVMQYGIVKNTLAISTLLSQGIGDTIRVSLTENPIEEVIVARNILQECGYPQQKVDLVSCPMCGRCQIDLVSVAKQVYDYVKNINVQLKIAVMGCEVNGPGECASAELGLAGGRQISFFKKGVIYKKVDKKDAVKLFLQEIDKLVIEKQLNSK
ncbi:MAG: flavodoxin-dependent (E)-4-hydroxy-3-methylbut-2-enyl-diphosphate synthase [Clostridia bacterium]